MLIQQYLALSADASHVKEFTQAAKAHLEAGRHVDSLVRSYRERYGEDAPVGATLSDTDKDYLVKHVPGLRHVPPGIRNEFRREVIAARISDKARSYLPKEPRGFQERRSARDKRGARGK